MLVYETKSQNMQNINKKAFDFCISVNKQAKDKQSNNTMQVLDTTIRKTTTTNVNKTRALLPPTRGIYLPNTVYIVVTDITTRNCDT